MATRKKSTITHQPLTKSFFFKWKRISRGNLPVLGNLIAAYLPKEEGGWVVFTVNECELNNGRKVSDWLPFTHYAEIPMPDNRVARKYKSK